MRFEVVGRHTVDGVATGGTVEIDDAERARRLIRGGHIRPVQPVKKAPAKKAAATREESVGERPGTD